MSDRRTAGDSRCLLQTFLGARQAVSVDGDSWSKHAAGVHHFILNVLVKVCFALSAVRIL